MKASLVDECLVLIEDEDSQGASRIRISCACLYIWRADVMSVPSRVDWLDRLDYHTECCCSMQS